MKVLPSQIVKSVRDGNYQYAMVEDIKLGLATIRLGNSGDGARITNLNMVGNIKVGDKVVVDYSISRPWVRAILATEEEVIEEEAKEPHILAPLFKRLKMGAYDPLEICSFEIFAVDPRVNALYITTARLIKDKSAWAIMVSYNFGETWNIYHGGVPGNYSNQVEYWISDDGSVYVDGNDNSSFDSGKTWTETTLSYWRFWISQDGKTQYFLIRTSPYPYVNLFRSHDFGQTTTLLDSFPAQNEANYVSASKGKIVLKYANIAAWVSTTNGSSWNKTTFAQGYVGQTQMSPEGDYCIIDRYGFAAAGIYTSRDNGLSWQKTLSNPSTTTGAIWTATAIRDLNAIIIHADTTQVTGYEADCYITYDGISWTKLSMPFRYSQNNIHFTYLNGVLFAHYDWMNGMWRSHDMGNTWTPLDLKLPSFRDDRMPITVSPGGKFIHSAAVGSNCISRDGGETWEIFKHIGDWDWNPPEGYSLWGPFYEPYRSALSFDGQHCVLICYDGYIIVSHDYMGTWKWPDITYSDEGGFAPSFGTRSWFQNGGYSAHLSMSWDGGVIVHGSSIPEWYTSNPRGFVYVSSDYGQTFKEILMDYNLACYVWTVVSGDGKIIYAPTWGNNWYQTKDSIICRSSDHGETWDNITPMEFNNSTDWGFQVQSSYDGSTVVALSNKYLWVSKDYGETWEIKLASVWDMYNTTQLIAVSSDGNKIIVSGNGANDDIIHMSFNSGESWQTIDVDPCICNYSEIEQISASADFSKIILMADWGYVYINENYISGAV